MSSQSQPLKDKTDKQSTQEETFAWQMIEALSQGIVLVDAQHKFEYVNPAAVKITGRSSEELLHLTTYDVIHPDDHKKLQNASQQRHANQSSTYEIRIVTPDNTIVYAHISGSPRFEEGQYIGSYTVITDLTEQKKAAETQHTQANLLANLNDAVILTDLDFNIKDWNHAAEQLYGWSKESIIGKNLGEIIQTKYVKGNRADAIARFNKDNKWKGEVIQQNKAGHNIYVLSSVIKLLNQIGEPSSILAINRDITETRLAEQKIRESEERLRLLIDNAPVALAMFDMNMCYIAHSPKWITDYGLEGQNIIGRSHYDVFPEIGEKWKVIHQSALKGEVYVKNEDRFTRLDGRVHWLRGEIRPWYTADQEIGGVLIFTEDISKQKEVEQALKYSETRYRIILEDHPEMIMRAKANGTLLFANTAYCHYFNVHPDKIIGRNFFDLLEEEIKPIVKAKIKQLSLKNPVLTSENPDNRGEKHRWIRWTDRGIFDDEGKLIEVQAVGYDITMRREAEDQLRRSEAQLQQIIDTVPEGILLLTSTGQITRTNSVARELLTQLLPDPDTNHITRLGDRPLSDFLAPPPVGLWHDVNHNGRIFEVIAQPLEEKEVITSWVMMIYDATEERQIRHKMEQEYRLIAIGQLAAGIAHDFNNILAVITLYSQLITRRTDIPPKVQKQSATIETQAQRASDLVQQILDFGRKSMLEPQTLDLRPFLKQLITLLERVLPETITIRLETPSYPCTIEADPSRLQQVIMNLATNARDSMGEGGRLSFTLTPLDTAAPHPLFSGELPIGRWVKLKISDTGTGIQEDVLTHIFEPFFTTKEVGKGSGLGLAQVYGIVKQHHGHIDIVTQANHGTTFTLFFPFASSKKTKPAKINQPSIKQGNNQTILVVEDDSATRAALVESLLTLNYQISEVRNGREALTLLTSKDRPPIDLILTDVVMPQMGGIPLLKTIRAQQINLPVVLLTGHPLTEEINNLQSLNLSGWLLKPPSLEQLSQLLAKALNI